MGICWFLLAEKGDNRKRKTSCSEIAIFPKNAQNHQNYEQRHQFEQKNVYEKKMGDQFEQKTEITSSSRNFCTSTPPVLHGISRKEVFFHVGRSQFRFVFEANRVNGICTSCVFRIWVHQTYPKYEVFIFLHVFWPKNVGLVFLSKTRKKNAIFLLHTKCVLVICSTYRTRKTSVPAGRPASWSCAQKLPF